MGPVERMVRRRVTRKYVSKRVRLYIKALFALTNLSCSLPAGVIDDF